ncbi:MAG TPA: HEAT repeat domain-containing protein [Methanoregulaceae archaeon]|nr:HEAT repeat domain-containing protein [Methanoregulaceae archaeon]
MTDDSRLIADPDPSHRWRAAEALGRRREREAVGTLVALLDDDDWRVRAKAIWALGEIGDPAALPHLRRLYPSESESNQDLIRSAVARIQR